MSFQQDTITAVATPPGRGGVAIVRVSGPLVESIAKSICGTVPSPRQAQFVSFKNAEHETIDEGMVIRFVAPQSFTGEDVLELQGHGGEVVVSRVLNAVLTAGARLARAGEFSERAFLNNKIDLVQAEAVADLIDAESEHAARSAMRSLQGDFSSHITALVKRLIGLRQFIEATIDFPEEDIDFIESSTVVSDLQSIQQQLREIDQVAHQGVLLKDGMTAVIAGKPNAGKSSLLNALSGRDSAIVTAMAGTTRDTLRERIQLDGMPLHIIDTAGIRESDNPVEKIGVQRAHQVMAQADLIILVVDVSQSLDLDFNQQVQLQYANTPIIEVHNKMDLLDALPASTADRVCCVSIKQGLGMDALVERLKQHIGYCPAPHQFIARQRHLEALQEAEKCVADGLAQWHADHSIELLAEDLRQAQLALNRITGEFSSDDLLGEIFSSFCIGK